MWSRISVPSVCHPKDGDEDVPAHHAMRVAMTVDAPTDAPVAVKAAVQVEETVAVLAGVQVAVMVAVMVDGMRIDRAKFVRRGMTRVAFMARGARKGGLQSLASLPMTSRVASLLILTGHGPIIGPVMRHMTPRVHKDRATVPVASRNLASRVPSLVESPVESPVENLAVSRVVIGLISRVVAMVRPGMTARIDGTGPQAMPIRASRRATIIRQSPRHHHAMQSRARRIVLPRAAVTRVMAHCRFVLAAPARAPSGVGR